MFIKKDRIFKHSLKTGVSFGLPSGIITALGVMVGLHSGTHSKLAIIGGILTIAVADSFSDALGMHVCEECGEHHPKREIWESTIFTFISKFFFTASFLIPVLLFPLPAAVIISVIYGLFMLGLLSFYIAKNQKQKALIVIAEHIIICLIVIVLTYYIGNLINKIFD